jgi:hypothetical protein
VTRNGEDIVVVVGIEEYRALRQDGASFKRFLAGAPDFEALGIERAPEPARAVEL